MKSKQYYGGIIAGLGAGFFLGFVFAGEGIVPYGSLSRIALLAVAIGTGLFLGPHLARSDNAKSKV